MLIYYKIVSLFKTFPSSPLQWCPSAVWANPPPPRQRQPIPLHPLRHLPRTDPRRPRNQVRMAGDQRRSVCSFVVCWSCKCRHLWERRSETGRALGSWLYLSCYWTPLIDYLSSLFLYRSIPRRDGKPRDGLLFFWCHCYPSRDFTFPHPVDKIHEAEEERRDSVQDMKYLFNQICLLCYK